ncbi:MAG: glycosidase [Candidatus Latescibacterota bacterium]|nr:MAG: glycosidase [Candidatus Latescibacterota bacterium]
MHHQELFRRCPDNPILTVDDWPYPANSVFNAAAATMANRTVLLVRVEDFRGISHLTTAKSKNGIDGWQIDHKPTFAPDPDSCPEEVWGIEDPRVTWLNDQEEWGVAYTAYSEGGPMVSLATTRDFCSFVRIGPVLPPEDKDAALFPVRFNDQWAMVHRPISTHVRLGAHIWVSFSPDLKHWGDHQHVILARHGSWWDANKIGLSAPPMETSEGWLILYHGVRTTVSGSIYRLGLALLDLDNPTRLTHRTDEWIFGPKAPYEREGDVDEVVFPCGWLRDGDDVRMYYGAADLSIALATASLQDLLDFVLRFPYPQRK